jgi:beta-glucosidase
VQNYSRLLIGEEGVLPYEEGVEMTQAGYEFYPEALAGAVRLVVDACGKPVIVTENGLAGEDDSRRVEFIKRALTGLHQCLDDGLDVRGYYYWAALDNWEWMLGYGCKFGLIAVNRETQARQVKESARYLGQIARSNGTDLM